MELPRTAKGNRWGDFGMSDKIKIVQIIPASEYVHEYILMSDGSVWRKNGTWERLKPYDDLVKLANEQKETT